MKKRQESSVDVEVVWTDQDELALIFYAEDGEVEDQYFIEEPVAYNLYMILHKKFQKLSKIVKESLESSDSNSSEDNS